MPIDVRLLAPLATTIGIAVTLILWQLNQRKKALSYMVLRQQPVVNLKGAVRNELDVRFAGESISDAHLMVVRIFNSGHLPINVTDYQTSLSLLLNPGAKIITASVIDTVPVDLEERVKADDRNKSLIQRLDGERIMLTPVLLNDGDAITIQMLVQNVTDSMSVRGHIQGISKVNAWHQSRLVPRVFTQFGAFIMAFGMLGVRPSDLVALKIEYVLPWAMIFLIGYVFLNAGIYWPTNGRYANFR